MRTTRILAVIAATVLVFPAVGLGQETDTFAPHEQQAMSDTFQYALESDRINEASDWVNPDTGHAGTVTPVRTYADAGQPCREFITTIIIGGREEQGYGNACRQEDGTWQIVSKAEGAAPRPQPAGSRGVPAAAYSSLWYGHGYPPAYYYYYPAAFYGTSRIFFSFNYVYRDGHRHYGIRYADGRSFRHRHPLTIHRRVIIGPYFQDRHPWFGHGHNRFGGHDEFRGQGDFRRHQDIRRHDVFRGNHDFRRHDDFQHDMRFHQDFRDRHDFRGHDSRGRTIHERSGQGPGFWRGSGRGGNRR
jgi:surface antigen